MKQFKYTCWISGFFLLTSCSFLNQKETVIMGMAFDQSTEQPVSGLTINLHNEVSSLIPFSSVGGGIVATTTTDENGWYELKLDLDSRSRNYYTIEADLREEPFFHNGWEQGDYLPTVASAFIYPGDVHHVNIPLVSYGKLDIRATNSSAFDDLLFHLTMSISGYERTSFYHEVDAGESYEQTRPVFIPQGDVEFNWQIIGAGIDTNFFFTKTISKEDSNYIDFSFEG